MKIQSKFFRPSIAATLCGIAIFGLGACKDKPKPADAEQAAEEAAEAVASEPTVELDASGYNARRTQAFGFLSRMPASTEGAFGVRNLSDAVAGILGSNTFKRAMTMAQQMGGDSLDVQQVQMVQAMIDQYVGKEMFMIFSQGTAAQVERIQLISEMLNEINMRSAGAALGQGAGGDTMQAMQLQIRASLTDPDSELSTALEEFEFPPVIMGTKVSDGADEVVAQLDAVGAELPPIFTASKIDVGGGKFTSWKLNLQDVFDEGAKASLNEFLQDEAASERVAEIIRKKTVEFCFGVIDNYLVFSLGSDHGHLKFESAPEKSILAAKAFGFSDQFLDKPLFTYGFLSKSMLAGGMKPGQIQSMADAFAAGIGGGGAAAKKLGTLLQKMAGQAEKLAERGSQTFVGLTYMDEGIRGESIGGYTTETVDSKAVSQFANAAPADAAMVISSVSNSAYRDESIAMMETMFEGVEVGVEVWSESSGDSSAREQFGQMKEMFGANLGNVWGILKGDFLDGLGSQSGMIVDLKGGMPKGIPGLPNVLQNEGKVPRIALMADVADREKLAAAWEALVPELNEAFLKIPGQEAGSEFQLPDTISSDGDGLTTHFFSLPFLTNDFLPSLSLNDEMFLMSTSKLFAQDLAAGSKEGDGSIRGTYIKMNLAELHRFSEEWLALVSANAAQIFPEEAQADEFRAAEAQIRQVLEFTKGIHGVTFNRYQEDSGAMRSSWHLKFEDIGVGGN
ncbi:MAG: hypothetical protein ACR2RV_18160 [Verrucomicrobiales bacterium]